MTINVIDAPMGFGKTTGSINFINKRIEKDDGAKFLYITPYLDEVKRIKANCSGFEEPSVYGTKINGIKALFLKDKNVVSTHSLFKSFDEETIDFSFAQGYCLFMDEVADVVEPFPITKKDLDDVLTNYATISDNNLLVWHDREYKGVFDEIKRLCDLQCITAYTKESGESVVLLWAFPISIFRAFREIYIATYMFDAQIQKYYYDYYGCDYRHWYVENTNAPGESDLSKYNLTETPQQYDLSYVKDLVSVIDNPKLNAIGDAPYSLSKSWFERNHNGITGKKLKNNTVNFFINITKTPSDLNMWTVFKDYKNTFAGKGYSKGFIPFNARATNKYASKKSVAYLINVFLNPFIKNFFMDMNIEVREDEFALSELVQFIWRSAIRNKQPISIYIPSKRMRELLLDWMNSF